MLEWLSAVGAEAVASKAEGKHLAKEIEKDIQRAWQSVVKVQGNDNVALEITTKLSQSELFQVAVPFS